MNTQTFTNTDFDTKVLQIINSQQAWHYEIIPLKMEANQTLHLLVSEDKVNDRLKLELEVLLGYQIQLSAIPTNELKKLLSKLYRKEEQKNQNIKSIDISDLKQLLPNLINEAQQLKSSDIHLEPYEESCRVRMRIDGVLVERYILNKAEYPSLINKIKIQANLDISEKRLPQDGRIFFNENSKNSIDIRVSTLPTLHGEKIVMRLLSRDASNIELEQLGLEGIDLENYLSEIKKPNGIILISGPTGSGKTTTLYATLKLLNQPTTNILTIEDPIEYTLEGINQVQLRDNIGLDFVSALKTFLRQDPDIIMVGEIRDKATATMAIRAALTGHLVFSTIHTNSAWGIISRLSDMNVPNYLIADTLNMAVAQRLVRCLCSECKKETAFNESAYPKNYRPLIKIKTHYEPVGCQKCYFTGYKGRKAVYEVLPIDYELSKEIKADNSDILAIMNDRNHKSLAENAFELFKVGITSIDEVYPILASSN